MNSTKQKVNVKKVSLFYLFIKRAFDIIVSLFALILLSLPMLIIAIIIKAGDGGNVFYSQNRVGKNGKFFKLHKFRSMVKNSHEFENLLTEEQLEQYNAEFKIDDDPRITRFGKFLRKTSLDELPQFWDILVGNISFIGPRPLLEKEIEQHYPDTKDLLLSCKPGLTGYWQAYARNDATYETGKRQKMEFYYLENRSFLLDIKIIFKTFSSVLGQKGAK